MNNPILIFAILLGLGAILGMIVSGVLLWAADRRIRRRHGLQDEAAVARALNAYEGKAQP